MAMKKERLIKRCTYRNLMIIANKIHREKGYAMEESIRLAEMKFKEFNPKGMPIESMVDMMLSKEEWENRKATEMLINAIQKFTENPRGSALSNFACYLENHFSEWLKKYANTPLGMATEFKSFAEMIA